MMPFFVKLPDIKEQPEDDFIKPEDCNKPIQFSQTLSLVRDLNLTKPQSEVLAFQIKEKKINNI